jgi:hypothetical protein
MIKSFTAITREIDDIDLAVSEIVQAINPEKNLLKNSLGIVSCFSEFEETGVLKAICDALPFDCIGTTTCICSANKETDQILFAIVVLTSDDCQFDATMLPISENYVESIDSVLSEKLNKSESKPALMLSFFPMIRDISGDMMLEAIDKATGGIPLFGTMTVDHKLDFSSAKTIYNGVAYREAAIIGSIYGNVNYSFEIASISDEMIRKQKAVITDSKDNILISVNGKSAVDYLEEIGLKREDIVAGSTFLPLIIAHKDGTVPIVRGVLDLNSEGHVICEGSMPVGTTLSIGRLDAQDVISTTCHAIKKVVGDDCVVLAYSCIARYLTLGLDGIADAEKAYYEALENTNYFFTSSGGEICPLPDRNGKLRNHFHNFTIVLCKLS